MTKFPQGNLQSQKNNQKSHYKFIDIFIHLKPDHFHKASKQLSSPPDPFLNQTVYLLKESPK